MNTRTITITDPREFEGDPYQVAQRAIQQLSGLVRILISSTDDAGLMIRNAELERCLASGIEGDELRKIAQGWSQSPQGRILDQMVRILEEQEVRLKTLERAAAYDPKAGRGGRPAKGSR